MAITIKPTKTSKTDGSGKLFQFNYVVLICLVLLLGEGLVNHSGLKGSYISYYEQQTNDNNKRNETTIKLNVTESLIYDKTIPWDPTVDRKWLHLGTENERPPAMLLVTNYGWNQRDQTEGINYCRHKRGTDFMKGIINHPWFHPTFWEDFESGNVTIPPDDTTRYYVFMDIQIYMDSNYPKYGGGRDNMDTDYGRPRVITKRLGMDYFGNAPIYETKLFQQAKGRVRLIVWDGAGFGIPLQHNRINGTLANKPISYVAISAYLSRVDHTWDQGLVAPAPNPVPLSESQEKDIETCDTETQRKFFASYTGNLRSGRNSEFHRKYGGARASYATIRDDKTVFLRVPDNPRYQDTVLSNLSYAEILHDTVFALAPRGDNKFSYRFHEILSAGTIPVVHADDWMWPFRPELVDWNECAIIMPEKDAGQTTIDILKKISVEERCNRRKKCYQLFKDYIETPEGQIRGIIEGLELVATRDHPAPMVGVKCADYNYSEECNMMR